MKQLSKSVLDILVKKSKMPIESIRPRLSEIRGNNPHLTLNAAAQIFAKKHHFSVLGKLDDVDRASLPAKIVSESTHQMSRGKPKKIKREVPLFTYDSHDHFIMGHVKEANRAFNNSCYTATFILVRKILENLIIQILRKRFPESIGLVNVQLYFNTKLNRTHDFKVVLKSLFDKKNDFGHSVRDAVVRLYQLCMRFKDDANDKTHSWFHLVESPREIREHNIQSLFELIKAIEIDVGLRPAP